MIEVRLHFPPGDERPHQVSHQTAPPRIGEWVKFNRDPDDYFLHYFTVESVTSVYAYDGELRYDVNLQHSRSRN